MLKNNESKFKEKWIALKEKIIKENMIFEWKESSYYGGRKIHIKNLLDEGKVGFKG